MNKQQKFILSDMQTLLKYEPGIWSTV